MKNFLFYLIAFVAFVGCSDVSSYRDVPSGIFVRSMVSEFSVAEDSVVVTPKGNGWLELRHNIAYQRIDKSPGQKQLKTSTFNARYEPKSKECINPKTGGRYSFPEDGKSLLYNGAIYTAVP